MSHFPRRSSQIAWQSFQIYCIDFCHLAGCWWAVRLQVRLQSGGAFLHGVPGQPEAKSEEWPRRCIGPKRGRCLPRAHLRGRGSISERGRRAVHPGLSRRLPLLAPTAWITEQNCILPMPAFYTRHRKDKLLFFKSTGSFYFQNFFFFHGKILAWDFTSLCWPFFPILLQTHILILCPNNQDVITNMR